MSSAARKALRKLPRTERERIGVALGRLPGGDVRPLRNRPEFRLRVGGWRVLFEIDDRQRRIIVANIGSRDDVYK